MSGKRYQSGYDDGFKAGEWAAGGDTRRSQSLHMRNPQKNAESANLLTLCKELRDALAAAMRVMANYEQAGYYFLLELDKLGIARGIGKRADKALAPVASESQGDSGERSYSAAEVQAIWLGAMESQIKSPEIRERLKAEALRRYPEKPREASRELEM